MRTPYIKKIVELHKIHKAIEAQNSGGGDGGNTQDEKFIGFPLFIAKVVGFLDITEPQWDGNSLVTDDDIIPIDGVFDYCEADESQNQWYFGVVYEYDESLDTYEGYSGYLGYGSFEVGRDGNNYSCGAYKATTCMPLYVKGQKYLIAWQIGD